MSLESLVLRGSEGGALVGVKVTPRGSVNSITGVENGVLKIKVHSPPVEGAANEAVKEFLSEVFGIPKSSIRILKGERSRSKTLQFRGMGRERVLEALRIHLKEGDHG